ncbi:DUF642 domain-containing protein [Streptomyces caeruleatus]|uniref:DUF642 domain-containing protein n=1 Tax=Streptomyces caeruleatus TaxID=661399 RepID=A0A101TX72_9ACTN|nr:DUF642 domain-containing protein [Streptomyces caeruleatus]KUO00031.1 hypothetical protein AQJ67_24495 [Streptomyces caeruleatus]
MPTENLVRNGTFTEPRVSGAAKSWRPVHPAAAYRATGWDPVNAYGYDHLNAAFANHPNGLQAVDLGINFTNGGIKQTVETKAGATYNLSFECSPNEYNNCNGRPNNFTVKVTDDVGGREITSRDFDPGVGYGRANWQRKEFSFQAKSSRTTITFMGMAPGSCQSGITNVSVIGLTDGQGTSTTTQNQNQNKGPVTTGQDQELTNLRNKVNELTGQVSDLTGKLAECQRTSEQLRKNAQDAAAEYRRGRQEGWAKATEHLQQAKP